MPVCKKEQRECQTEPREEEKRGRAIIKLQEAHRLTRRTGQAAIKALGRAISPLKGPKEAQLITGVREHDAEQPIEGNEGQPEHQTADDADHLATQQGPQQ